jgi:hypothetical protein
MAEAAKTSILTRFCRWPQGLWQFSLRMGQIGEARTHELPYFTLNSTC